MRQYVCQKTTYLPNVRKNLKICFGELVYVNYDFLVDVPFKKKTKLDLTRTQIWNLILPFPLHVLPNFVVFCNLLTSEVFAYNLQLLQKFFVSFNCV